MSETDKGNLLSIFKARMHIFHDSEDKNLQQILNSSTNEIKRLTGSDDITISGIQELVLERSRYVYNDAAEFFEDNFQAQILGVSAEINIKGDDSDADSLSASTDV